MMPTRHARIDEPTDREVEASILRGMEEALAYARGEGAARTRTYERDAEGWHLVRDTAAHLSAPDTIALASQYSLLIQWSSEAQTYLVSLPEWAERVPQPAASGATDEEAIRRGRALLVSLVEQARRERHPLPPPRLSPATAAD
jgi:predicted RNase H-like HicB family nuclease